MLSAMGRNTAKWEVETEFNFSLVGPRWSEISHFEKSSGNLEM